MDWFTPIHQQILWKPLLGICFTIIAIHSRVYGSVHFKISLVIIVAWCIHCFDIRHLLCPSISIFNTHAWYGVSILKVIGIPHRAYKVYILFHLLIGEFAHYIFLLPLELSTLIVLLEFTHLCFLLFLHLIVLCLLSPHHWSKQTLYGKLSIRCLPTLRMTSFSCSQ